MPDEEQVIDVERLVEDVRERVERERSGVDGTGKQLAVPEPAAPVHWIALQPSTIVSNKRLVGPLITFVRRVVLRVLALPLQDLINQMNTAVEGAQQAAHNAIRDERLTRQAMLEREAAAREQAEREISLVKKRFDGVDTALNQIEIAHRAGRAELTEALVALKQHVREALEAETEERTAVQLDADHLSRRIDELGSRLARLDRALRSSAGVLQPTEGDRTRPPERAAGTPAPIDYVTFEARFRPEDAVAEHQRLYVDLLRERRRVVDLGCGRGELLELLQDSGVSAYGVDVEPDFILLVREKGFEVVEEDAVTHVEEMGEGAVDAITASHLIEHLSPEAMVRLLTAAADRLPDEGILVLETPNPESLLAGSVNFHRDPTHVHPIHPDTLAFLCESVGFGNVEVRRLSPVPPPVRLPSDSPEGSELGEHLDRVVEQLNDFLYGYQDYAVIARK